MRSFIAFEIEAQSKLTAFIAKLKTLLGNDRIKWVNLPVLHQTLFFLGEISEEQLIGLNNGLSNSLQDLPSFEITIRGLGVFRSKRNPKVIWVGIEDSELLNNMHKKVCEATMPFGFVPDKRGFNPHITIGRVKSITSAEKLFSIVGENTLCFFQKSLVSNVTLFKSNLTPQGPIYTPLFRQELLGKPPAI